MSLVFNVAPVVCFPIRARLATTTTTTTFGLLRFMRARVVGFFFHNPHLSGRCCLVVWSLGSRLNRPMFVVAHYFIAAAAERRPGRCGVLHTVKSVDAAATAIQRHRILAWNRLYLHR